jgi:hypothetical protein
MEGQLLRLGGYDESILRSILDTRFQTDRYLKSVEPDGGSLSDGIGGLIHTIELNTQIIKQEETLQNQRYVHHILEVLEQFQAEFEVGRKVEDLDWSRIQEDVDYYTRGSDPVYPDIDLDPLFELRETWIDMESFLKSAQDKIKAFIDRMDSEYTPDPDDMEVLYHASVQAKSIAQNGFDPRVPERKGLGGNQEAGSKKGTSFTADLYVAKEIMRALKEITSIAQKRLQWRGLREMAKGYDVLDETLSCADYRGQTYPEDGNVRQLIQFYQCFLTVSDRYNPWFMGTSGHLASTFRDVNLSDIGVVSARVDMGHPDIEYLQAMEEFRVPPEAIIEVVDFLR